MNARAHIARRIEIGRLAGLLFGVGVIAAIPANLLFRNPDVGPLTHAMVVVAFVSSLACLVAPWGRVPDRCFHAIPVLAGAEIALIVWTVGRHGPVFEWYYVLVAVFSAYAFDSRRAIAAHTVSCTLLAALPILYRPDLSEQVARLGVLVPIIWTATAVVTHLRERLLERQRALADLARRDPLTGVGNRRLLAERLDYELAQHRRSGRPLAVLVLDLDGFKEVNDRLGHVAGDRLLADVGAALTATVRAADTVVRHGGDEFCVIAPETDAAEAETLSDRIRTGLRMVGEAEPPLTASVGVAIFPGDGTTPEALLAAADRHERLIKTGGRGQLTLT